MIEEEGRSGVQQMRVAVKGLTIYGQVALLPGSFPIDFCRWCDVCGLGAQVIEVISIRQEGDLEKEVVAP